MLLAADWYCREQVAGAPAGIVWVQHGFSRGKHNVAGLCRQLARRTSAVVVAPTIGSNPFALGGWWINGAPMWRAVAQLFAGERAALARSAAQALGAGVRLPRAFVLSGHSAGGNLALAAAGGLAQAGTTNGDLRAVVLYDAVEHGGAMRGALAQLGDAGELPVLQIAAPPNSCNAFGSGTRALVAARPGRFVGVQLDGGTHVDAEGSDSDWLAAMICGRPRPENVLAVRAIAGDWIASALSGAPSDGGEVRFPSDGSPGDVHRVGDATATVLPVD